jgi:hypothetical protein
VAASPMPHDDCLGVGRSRTSTIRLHEVAESRVGSERRQVWVRVQPRAVPNTLPDLVTPTTPRSDESQLQEGSAVRGCSRGERFEQWFGRVVLAEQVAPARAPTGRGLSQQRIGILADSDGNRARLVREGTCATRSVRKAPTRPLALGLAYVRALDREA